MALLLPSAECAAFSKVDLIEETFPSTEGISPSAVESSPEAEETLPLTEIISPSTEETSPTEEETLPFTEKISPSTEETSPTTEESVETEDTPLCFCPMDYNPVCASNSQTYANICLFNCNADSKWGKRLNLFVMRYGRCMDQLN